MHRREAYRVAGITFTLTVIAVLAATVIGARVWDRGTRQVRSAHRALIESSQPALATFSPEAVAGLPAPVRRYFELALPAGQRMIARATFQQSGTFAREPNVWQPFTATEEFTVWPPTFLWDARIRMGPVSAFVRDQYAQGRGSMLGKAAALVTVVSMQDTPEMASSSLLRYLAEAVWLPTALLPGAGVQWEAVDDSTARASLTDRDVTATMTVHFNPRGTIDRVSAQRYRDANGTPVLTPWIGFFRDWRRVDGMLVPVLSEVGWMLEEGFYSYWRGRTVGSEFEYR